MLLAWLVAGRADYFDCLGTSPSSRLHTYEQLIRDVENTLRNLRILNRLPCGVIQSRRHRSRQCPTAMLRTKWQSSNSAAPRNDLRIAELNCDFWGRDLRLLNLKAPRR
jgi:hypothetical protein